MGFNKKFFTTGGIVASSPAAAAFDPLQNFETVTYTGNGSTRKITGYIRKGAAFNGSSSRIETSKIVGLSDVSVSCWLRSTNTSSSERRGIIELNGDTSAGWAGTLSILYRYSDGAILVRSGNASSSEVDILTHTDISLRDGDWHNLIVTRNESTGVTTLYIDGSQADQETVSSTSTVGGGTLIGDRYTPSAGNYNWNGQIDQVRIFNKALSSSEVTTLYGETYASSTKSTTDIFGDGSGVALYELDDSANDTGGTYNGTATNVNYLGMAFQPDLVWIKARDNARHHRIFDSVRGENARGYYYQLLSSTTEAQSTYDSASWEGPYGGLTSLDSNGFTVKHGTSTAAYPYNGPENYVAWCWKAADTTTTIAAGTVGNTIASDVRANQDAGFSIVSYTGAGTTATVGHGLNSTVELLIVKGRETTNDWAVLHKDGADGNFLQLNSSAAQSGSGGIFGSPTARPTNSVFTIGNAGETGTINKDYIAYCFHSVDGYQSVGSYSGSNSDLQVDTGFQPRFLMLKNIDASGRPWVMIDSLMTGYLEANSSSAEADTISNYVTFNSQGFLLVGGTGSYMNESGWDFLYLAIA